MVSQAGFDPRSHLLNAAIDQDVFPVELEQFRISLDHVLGEVFDTSSSEVDEMIRKRLAARDEGL